MNVHKVIDTTTGEVRYFSGVTARFVTAHPRLSAWIAFFAGVGLGHVVWH